ncbi:MAG: bifunctional ornithine acetyltransferase/N-acetylglutamate synthase, partial [Spirochaetota bacterium]
MGYFFSSYPCGVKYANRDDIALVYADAPCNCIVLATRNRVKAAPVLLSLDRKNNPVRAILVNSGNANACTGEQGLRDITALTDETARLLEIDPLSVLAASTGVIGVPLPVNRMMNALPHLTANLAQDTVDGFSRAIMTTDTVPKVVSESFTTSRSTYTITAVSKGSGMIAPDMATLLSFVLCDAPISRIDMDSCFRKAVEISLNSITIDGDMSTNDSAFLLCPADGSYLSAPEDIAS